VSDDVSQNRPVLTAIVFFAVIASLIGWDLWGDYGEGTGTAHLALELVILLVAASGVVLLWRQLARAHADLIVAKSEAVQWRTENQQWVQGLGIAIQAQFTRWNLSKAEAEIGLLLLKGLSHKEIANFRQTSERTIREQARALYRKSGLPGRSSLSAFFLEDLLPQGTVQSGASDHQGNPS
jgi:DNA-binding CsgD family transcriptional regulator